MFNINAISFISDKVNIYDQNLLISIPFPEKQKKKGQKLILKKSLEYDHI